MCTDEFKVEANLSIGKRELMGGLSGGREGWKDLREIYLKYCA